MEWVVQSLQSTVIPGLGFVDKKPEYVCGDNTHVGTIPQRVSFHCSYVSYNSTKTVRSGLILEVPYVVIPGINGVKHKALGCET